MNLIIDQGNTFTKLAIFDADEIIHQRSVVNEEVTFHLGEITKSYSIKKGMLSSVANSQNIERFLRGNNIDFHTLSEYSELPFTNKYKNPASLGKDRLAGIAGAFQAHPNQNCLVIDAGTAITYDFINDKGEYLGGSISPGVNMRFKALNHFTQKLPLAQITDHTELPGTDTMESLQTGVLDGVKFEMLGFINHYNSLAPNLLIFLTGGDAELFDKNIKNSIFVARNLVLLGLNSLLEHNAH